MKLAFVHIMKTGGTTVNNALGSIANRHGYRLNTPAANFEPEAIAEIANGPEWNQYLHAHADSWTEDIADEFIDNGWRLVTFIRNPPDVLASMWRYAITVDAIEGDFPFDRYLNERFDDQEDPCWRIPEWWEKIHDVHAFSEASLAEFIKSAFNADWKPRRLNASGSYGFAHYLSLGMIEPDTIERLIDDRQMKLFRAATRRKAK
jgi:hypothetical protein